MLSGVSAKALWRSGRTSPARKPPYPSAEDALCDSVTSPSIQDELQIQEFNDDLLALTTIFPDVRADVFREMLSTFSKESRLHVVTEALLKQSTKFVRGRYKLPSKDAGSDAAVEAATQDVLPVKDRFRTAEYKEAVKAACYQEFRGLTHSTIRAVLAENNYSYLDSRQTLAEITAKSWTFSVMNLFTRRKLSRQCPLVDWTSEDSPRLRSTSSRELNAELENALIIPILRQKAEAQLVKDRSIANELNDVEAEEVGATFDCECCFVPNSFENITVCDESGHYICCRCICQTMKEVLFGQGWARSVDTSKCSLRCVAADSEGECRGSMPQTTVQRAMFMDDESASMWQRFEERVARETLGDGQGDLLRCPFCCYAEVSGSADGESWFQWRYVVYSALAIISCFSVSKPPADVAFALWLLVHVLTVAALVSSIDAYLLSAFAPDGSRHANQGRKFICRRAGCQKVSCLACSALWHDIHACHSSSRQSLRTYVEVAITDAIKRTCPRCHLSFVKASGCNKLVCTCGYSMCYLCRGQIGADGYAHFCPHFRPDGGACIECKRCDLYKSEDEDAVVREAKVRAEKEWWENEGKSLGAEKKAEWERQGLVSKPRRGWLFSTSP